MAANIAALRARAPLHPSLERYAAVARLLTGRKEATAEDGVDWVRALCADLNVPHVAHLGNRDRRSARRGGEGRPRQQYAGQSASAHGRGTAGRALGGVVSAGVGEQRWSEPSPNGKEKKRSLNYGRSRPKGSNLRRFSRVIRSWEWFMHPILGLKTRPGAPNF